MQLVMPAVQGVSFDATPVEVRKKAAVQAQLGQMSPSPFANSAPVGPPGAANDHHQTAAEPSASATQPVR